MGEFGIKETLEVVLAGAVIILLLFLLFRIIASFDEEDEIAKATLERLLISIEEAERGYPSNFSFFEQYDTNMFVVYFGEDSVVHGDSDDLKYSKGLVKGGGNGVFSFVVSSGKNKICICRIEETIDVKASCKTCKNIKTPLFIEDVENKFVINVCESLRFEKRDEKINVNIVNIEDCKGGSLFTESEYEELGNINV